MDRIYAEIINVKNNHLRLGVINYHDHPVKCHITDVHQPSDDSTKAKQFIDPIITSDSCDMPKAICSGLAVCLNSIEWLESSVKIVILFADTIR